MATATCTFGGRTHYNNGWGYSSFTTTSAYGHPGLGKFSSGQYRYTVVKITTPSFSGAASSITLKIPTVAATAGTHTYYYLLSTKGPTFASGGGSTSGADSEYNAAAGSSYAVASGSTSVTNNAPSNSSSTGGYKTQSITISSTAIKASTTYYIWLWCPSTLYIYYGHSSAVGTISATVTYTTTSYYKPSVSKTSVCGYYSGATFTVGAGSSYPYVYMGWSSTGTFWKKANTGSSYAISTDADTSSTSTKTLYVFRVNVDLGTSCSAPSSSYLASCSCNRFGAKIYNHTTSASQYNWNSGNPVSYSGYTLDGFSTSSTSTTASYTSSQIDGKTVYAIYSKAASSSSATKYWYRGSSTKNSVTMTTSISKTILYGTTSSTGGTVSYSYSSTPTITCASNSSYSLQGWASSSSTTTVTSYAASVDGLKAYWQAGNSTAYGVYKLNSSSSDTTKYWYRGSSTKNSITMTTTTAAQYYYGTGSHSGGSISYSYSSTPTITCASNSSYSLAGWSSSSSSTSTTSYAASVDGLKAYWQAGNSIAYGVYKLSESMLYYPQNGNSSNSVSTTNYYYGTGSKTSNIPAEPSLIYTNYTFKGWSSTSTGSVSSWATLWNNGIRTVYAIWQSNNLIYFGINNQWKLCTVYYGKNNIWEPIDIVRYGLNNIWNSSS